MDLVEMDVEVLIRQALAPDPDDRARLRLFQWLADNELILALDEALDGENITPSSVMENGAEHVIAFSDERYLADFSGGSTEYCAFAGRALFELLAEQGCGLSLNPGQSASIDLPPDVVSWVAGFLEQTPQLETGRIREVSAPEVDAALTRAMQAALAGLGDWIPAMWVVRATVDNAGQTLLCALPEVPEDVQASLSKAIMESVTATAGASEPCDVVFFAEGSALFGQIRTVGLKLDLAGREEPALRTVDAPGMNPDKPPRLI